ncbi:hypothetical protein MMC25_000788 [Agyrium rufum]|nr:hypothetical protein [Agyrium rufum]
MTPLRSKLPYAPEHSNPRRAAWKAKDPDKGLLNEVLRIKLHSFFDKRPNRDSDAHPRTKRRKGSTIAVDCVLTVWDSQQDVKFAQTCKAQIEVKDGTAQITMDEPFQIDKAKLANTAEVDSPKQTMQINIISTRCEDEWPPLPIKVHEVETKEILDASGLTRFPFLTISYKQLPELPADDLQFPVMAYQDYKTIKTHLRMRVNFWWAPAGTQSKDFNGVDGSLENATMKLRSQQRSFGSPGGLSNLRSSRVGKSSSVSTHVDDPTPATKPCIDGLDGLLDGTQESSSPESLVIVEWSAIGIGDGVENLTLKSLSCPLCDIKRPFHSLTEYYLHLCHTHGHIFHFQFDSNYSMEVETQRLVVTVKVQLSFVEGYSTRASNHVPDERTHQFSRPATFRNLLTLLENPGPSSNPMPKPRGRPVTRPRLEPSSTDSSVPKTVSHISRDPLLKRRRLIAEVPTNIPDEIKKSPPEKVRVPKPPEGIRFFDSRSKRVFVPGEEATESDANIDITWLRQKHDMYLDQLGSTEGIDPISIKFAKMWNGHTYDCELKSAQDLPVALLRFARIHRFALMADDKQLFKRLANLLVEMIHQELIDPGIARDIRETVEPERKVKEERRRSVTVERGAGADAVAGVEDEVLLVDDPMEVERCRRVSGAARMSAAAGPSNGV